MVYRYGFNGSCSYHGAGHKIMKEIDITDIGDFRIGNFSDKKNATGVTVIIKEDGMCAGVDIRGGGPASRETPLLFPVSDAQKIHALVLSGGSAFGLDASAGVMQYLEQNGIGLPTGFANVPLVCQSCIFDLSVGSASIRPDKEMGYAACVDSEKNIPLRGNNGAGTGASVGKIKGMERAMKSGIGIYAVEHGELKIGAIIVVNALGDIFEDGKKIAGLLSEDKNDFSSSEEELYGIQSSLWNTNTTIGAVITNGLFNKTELTKIASMAHNGYARAINPVNTMADGDSIYALSVGDVKADINAAGTMAAYVTEKAIADAVKSARSEYGLKGMHP